MRKIKDVKKVPRQYSLVKFDPKSKEYQFMVQDHKDNPHTEECIMDERVLIFLGDIPNMPGHCVLVGDSGKTYFGYHTDNFIELTIDEV